MLERKLVYRAGTIPYIVENGEVLMMFMMPAPAEYVTSEFQIAKGRVEDGEITKDAAVREAKEELGMFVSNIVSLEELGMFMGRTTVYIAKMKNRHMFGLPDEETEDVAWLTVEEFDRTGRELHRPVVRTAYNRIRELEDLF
jgi:8-oxo-dGTP pyrophosphatase MutT (NUDIX family)